MEISSIKGSDWSAGLRISSQLQAQEAKLNSFESAMESALNEKDKKELKASCQEFESYFLQTMFREMRKTTFSGGSVLPKSQAEEVFQDLMDEETSKSLSQSNGIGLADMMYKQLLRERGVSE